MFIEANCIRILFVDVNTDKNDVGMPGREIPGRAGDDVEELAGEVFCDSFYVGVDDGLFAGSALQILQVRMIVHEEVFCEDCGAEGFAEDVEVFFPVGIPI